MELKIVVNIKDDRAVIGVNSPDTDPYFTTATGNLHNILDEAALAVDAAREQWKTQPKYPAITIESPKPAAKEASAGKSKSGKNESGARPLPTPPPPAKNTLQRPMF